MVDDDNDVVPPKYYACIAIQAIMMHHNLSAIVICESFAPGPAAC